MHTVSKTVPSVKAIEELIETNKYLAHLPKQEGHKKETLEEHSEQVLTYCKRLYQNHKLAPVLSRLFKESVQERFFRNKQVPIYLEQLFFEAGYLHDIGKVNPNFQVKKMKNELFAYEKNEIGSKHALPGFLIFLELKTNEILENNDFNEEEKMMLISFAFLFGLNIMRHHAPDLPPAFKFLSEKTDFSDEVFKRVFKETEKLFPSISARFSPEFRKMLFGLDKNGTTKSTLLLKHFHENICSGEHFTLFALLKLHYSLLTASDYLSTTHFMNGWHGPLEDFGTISEGLKKKIIHNARESRPYNKEVYNKLHELSLAFPEEQSNKNLNLLRQGLAVETITNIRKNIDERIFYIEAPTGGGKTNLSMLALAEILEHHEVKNVFYVFPYTTLITQTYKAIKQTLGLSDDEVVEIHSKAGFPEKTEDEYGKDRKNHIDNLFIHYPVALLSHVRFFDIIKTNRKEQNYLLHRLANAVVIIDELQAYNPRDWDKVIYFIDNYARYFNIRFILMSATLPKLGELGHVKSRFTYLIKNKQKYFRNPNFCNRVQFNYSLLEWETPEKDNKGPYLEKLVEKVIRESQKYSTKNTKHPGSVFTIIEFIFKQTATAFYELISLAHDGFFEEIFVLSGSILEFRRKEIIYFLKNEQNRDKKILLVTTQVVEAGVDIDMDLGFKDQSLIDSDEQLAGRINRNVNKPACKLFLFNCDPAPVLYGSDKRFRLMQKELSGLYREILKSKDFDKLYNEVMKRIDKETASSAIAGFDEYEQKISRLDFPSIHNDFKIIDQQSASVFVPVCAPVVVPGTGNEEQNFSEKDIVFLREHGVKVTESHAVNGEDIFNLYSSLIENPANDFIQQKTSIKKLQGIMGQFTFSLMASSKDYQSLIERGCGVEKYGYYYLSHYAEDGAYDIIKGIGTGSFIDAVIF